MARRRRRHMPELHLALALLALSLAAGCGSAGEDESNAGGSGGTSGSGGSGAGGFSGAESGGSSGTQMGGSSGSEMGGSSGSETGGSSGSETGGTAGEGGSAGEGGAGGDAGSAGEAGSAGSAGAGGGGGSGSVAIKLIAIGDTGEGNTAQAMVADQMDAKCAAVGGCTAVLMLGDNFYDHGVQSTSDSQWGTKFEQIYDRPNLNSLKFYATLGNHDYGLTSSGKKEAQIQYGSLPVGTGAGTRPSDKWVMYDAYYDQRLPDPSGPVHLFALDTQDYSNTQINSMKAKVQASNAPWKIVFGHHPRYTSGNHYWDNGLLGIAGMYKLQEQVFCAGADIFLTGHDHNMEFIDKGAHSACPSVYFMISGAGSKLRSSSAPKHGKSLFYNQSVEALAYIEIVANTAKIEFIDKNGSLLYAKTITK
jgi:tartrate-resistant acid phosphatase type 5